METVRGHHRDVGFEQGVYKREAIRRTRTTWIVQSWNQLNTKETVVTSVMIARAGPSPK